MDSPTHPEGRLGSPTRWLEEHGDVLYRMALVRTGNPDLSEDPVQETLLAAWQKRDQFAGRSTERTWLMAILKRKVIDHFRRSWRQVSLNEDDAEDSGSGDFVREGEFAGRWKPDMAPVDWGIGPERALQERQLGHALTHCLRGLPDSLARVFAVREIDGLSTEEICQDSP
jgi:RNA polymerase sigma-70 factor (ECF subfamily)